MLYRSEQERDGTLRLYPYAKEDDGAGRANQNQFSDYLHRIDDYIESLAHSLWPLNRFIHENPELAFEEHKTHDALTSYLESYDDWQVTKSAYGLDTAWIAVYDSDKPGPVVSFNAEMGTSLPQLLLHKWKLITSRCTSWHGSCVRSQFDRHRFGRCWYCNSGDHEAI
jgi:hypothetical protein